MYRNANARLDDTNDSRRKLGGWEEVKWQEGGAPGDDVEVQVNTHSVENSDQ